MIRSNRSPHSTGRPSFTLVEMLIVMAIIALMASTVLFALYGVMESSKESRTRAQVVKLHELIMTKWEGYRTRRVPLNVPMGTTNNGMYIAMGRLVAIRDLQRMEFPERITDLMDNPVVVRVPTSPTTWVSLSMPIPSLLSEYRRAAGFDFSNSPPTPPATWTTAHQGAECLYMIVSAMREGESSGMEFFQKTEIGDVDRDGMPEILDGWGHPIEFLRWAPGFSVGLGQDGKWGPSASNDIGTRATGGDDDVVSELQTSLGTSSPDPFDPLKIDDDMRGLYPTPSPGPMSSPPQTFALYPLIFSSGRDEVYDIVTEKSTPPVLRYASTSPPVDPFVIILPATATDPELQIGTPLDITDPDNSGPDGVLGSVDNINNHLIDSQ